MKFPSDFPFSYSINFLTIFPKMHNADRCIGPTLDLSLSAGGME